MRQFFRSACPGTRRSLRTFPGLLLLGLACACLATATDTIVLKNGRRIVALTVAEDGDKVRYQTLAGELSLPKSIVDHIERGIATPLPDSLSAAAAFFRLGESSNGD